MFCPYVMKNYTKACLIDINENQTELGHVISENYQYQECKKKECGAWYKGRCNYNKKMK